MSSFKDDYSLLSSNVSALLSESTSTVITNIIGSDQLDLDWEILFLFFFTFDYLPDKLWNE